MHTSPSSHSRTNSLPPESDDGGMHSREGSTSSNSTSPAIQPTADKHFETAGVPPVNDTLGLSLELVEKDEVEAKKDR